MVLLARETSNTISGAASAEITQNAEKNAFALRMLRKHFKSLGCDEEGDAFALQTLRMVLPRGIEPLFPG